ncbi:DoxX family protein [Nitratireductor sp. GCM10026969]|uniref:DoxX family protein n=1 Tax=Nitratireductor sp. GCM10026969 TaxID=3252645 RepID=UPI003616D3F9
MPKNFLVLLGRILIAVIFVASGFGKLTDIAGTAGYFGSIGLPMPTATSWIVGLLEFLAGLAVLFGLWTRIAAVALAAFTVGAALVAHLDFADQMQVINLMKNLAMAGGLLVLAAHGPGAISVDSRGG